jgi:hypothetical protein
MGIGPAVAQRALGVTVDCQRIEIEALGADRLIRLTASASLAPVWPAMKDEP